MLFDPIKIGSLECKNRLAMAPMTAIAGYVNSDGSVNQRFIDLFTERAKGGVGLIILGASSVERELERSNNPLISRSSMSSYAELAEAVHYFDTKLFVQLSAGLGRAIFGEAIDAGVKPVSASEVPSFWRPETITRSLSVNEIERLVEAFGKAARLLSSAGIDGVEIHGHGGYLLDQFLTSLWNKRTDQYGGDLEGRARLAIEILKKIKEAAGPKFPVTFRLSLKHFVKGLPPYSGALKNEDFKEEGRDIQEGLELVKLLEKAGYDALHVDAGCYESRYWVNVPLYHPHGCMIDLAAQVKKVVNIPVIGVGRINTPDLAEQYLRDGKADVIALGRPLLADPYWPVKAKSGKKEDILPCTGCHDGCRYRTEQNKPLSCAVNPVVGKEALNSLNLTSHPQKIIVVGGGVAGMETARIASIRGHEVKLFEKSWELGGHLKEVAVPAFKNDYQALLDWYRAQLSRTSVKISLGITATPEIIKHENPNAIIIATGSIPIIPKIPNIENSIAVTASDLLLGKRQAGDKVLVAGGGLVGCETALWLAQQGKSVCIVEMLPKITLDTLFANKLMLLDLLAYYKVEIRTNTSIIGIGDGEAIVNQDSKNEGIKCDTIVMATGLKAVQEIYKSLRQDATEIYMIGDCKKPRKIMDAIWEGYHIGRAI